MAHDDAHAWLEPGVATPYVRVPVWLARRTDLTIYERAAYVALASYLAPGETPAWPSAQTLAERMGCSARQAQRALGGLMAAGILVEQQRPGKTTLRWLRFTEPGGDSQSGVPLTDSHPNKNQVNKKLSTSAPSSQTSRASDARASLDDDLDVVAIWGAWTAVALEPFDRTQTLSPSRTRQLKRAAAEVGPAVCIDAIAGAISWYRDNRPDRLRKGSTSQLQVSDVLSTSMNDSRSLADKIESWAARASTLDRGDETRGSNPSQGVFSPAAVRKIDAAKSQIVSASNHLASNRPDLTSGEVENAESTIAHYTAVLQTYGLTIVRNEDAVDFTGGPS